MFYLFATITALTLSIILPENACAHLRREIVIANKQQRDFSARLTSSPCSAAGLSVSARNALAGQQMTFESPALYDACTDLNKAESSDVGEPAEKPAKPTNLKVRRK